MLGKRGPSAWGINEQASRASAVPRELWEPRSGVSAATSHTLSASYPNELPREAVQVESPDLPGVRAPWAPSVSPSHLLLF